jgi:adenylate cyclase
VTTLLESPSGLAMGGEKRKVTMLMSDLRGFTALSERLAPQRVVSILNSYFATMTKVIKQYEGTIDEFIGDAILVLFGAPTWREDDSQRAVACAVAMQLAMESVNEYLRQEDLPELEMGIGIHTGQVVVGNIGSPERMKYGVVGSHVNLTSRIQSYTTGGQILISETTRKDLGGVVRVGKRLEIKAKGIVEPVTLCEALGIGGRHKLFLPAMAEPLTPLVEGLELRCATVDGTHVDADPFEGRLLSLSSRSAEVRLQRPVATPNLSFLARGPLTGPLVSAASRVAVFIHRGAFHAQ